MNYKQAKHIRIHKICSRILVLSVAASVVYAIFLYSNNIGLMNKLSSVEQSIESLDTEIASAKNDLYQMTDFADLEDVVDDFGLVREFRPEYLNLSEVAQLSLGT